MDYVRLGQAIRECRRANKITQTDFAKLVGLSPSFIGHIERGGRKASLESIIAIANALHIGVDRLIAHDLIVAGKWNDIAVSEHEEDTLFDLLAVIRNHYNSCPYQVPQNT